MQYLYYRIYKALTRVKTNDTPALNAMILIVVLQAFNVLSVFGVINYYYKWEFSKQQTIVSGLSLYIILLIPNYIYLFRKKDKIVKRYNNETKEDKKWGITGTLIYIVFTIAIFFALGETIVQKHY